MRGSPLSTLYLAMPSGPVTDQWGERLPRHLGLWSAIAVLVGSTIGSGIFRVPAGVAQRLHDPGPVVVAWIIGGAVALFGALTLAELAAALPRSGGVFAYLLEGFGPLPAFLFGWSELTVIRGVARLRPQAAPSERPAQRGPGDRRRPADVDRRVTPDAGARVRLQRGDERLG